MMDQNFVNQKLQFVEEIILHTDAHVFLTGKAGTGKTTFLKSLPMKTAKRMAVVAPTGVAAINAGGQTIHSFFQLPFGAQIPEDAQNIASRGNFRSQALATQFQKIRKPKLQLMRALDLLIIDEISMVRADVLDAIDAVLRRARRSSRPFGGVQLMMIGDVHQLAPVAKPEEWEILAPYYDTTYFFGSHVLRSTPYLCVELDHIYRQHDEDFIGLLNKVRHNEMDADCVQLLNSRYQPNFIPKDDDGYITLTTHNYQADDINSRKLDELKGEKLIFTADIEGIFPESMYPTRETLELKIGAQVMFIKNDPNPEKAYYNGKVGKLKEYNKENDTLVVQCGNEQIPVSKIEWANRDYTLNEETQQVEETIIGSFTQIPLRLAWAVTIHKSQGLTFDKLIVDAGKAFAHGQVYVALSRCTSLQGLVLKTRLTPQTLVNDYKVNYFVDQMPEKAPSREKVDQLRLQYELDNLLELIDFQKIYRDIGKLAGILFAYKKLFEPALIQDLVGRMERVQHELCDVGTKFARQLKNHQQDNPVSEENRPLQERLKNAAAYFKEHLNGITNGLFDLPFKTENKAVNEQLTESITGLYTDVAVKRECLEACAGGFSAVAYLRAKSAATMKAEKRENRPPAIRDAMMEKGSLYEALKAWRDEKADEEDAVSYNIVPNKTLKNIASAEPITLRELKGVDGMGPKRVSQYGEEIVTIVRQFSNRAPNEDGEWEERQLRKTTNNTFLVTKEMIDKGMTVEEIAKKRGLAQSTIFGHIARLVGDSFFNADRFVDSEKCDTIRDYFESTGDPSLGKAREVLGDEYDFWELRAMLAEMQRE
jgi:nucleoside-triphosphatase THEP1